MSRYQACRRIGLDPVAAAFLSVMNWLFDVPPGLIKFMTVEIEYEEHP